MLVDEHFTILGLATSPFDAAIVGEQVLHLCEPLVEIGVAQQAVCRRVILSTVVPISSTPYITAGSRTRDSLSGAPKPSSLVPNPARLTPLSPRVVTLFSSSNAIVRLGFAIASRLLNKARARSVTPRGFCNSLALIAIDVMRSVVAPALVNMNPKSLGSVPLARNRSSTIVVECRRWDSSPVTS
jgi:hypothetical protein